MVQVLQANSSSPMSLAGHIPDMVAGIQDADTRIVALETTVKLQAADIAALKVAAAPKPPAAA
jgi:hypothetical protein